MVIMHLRIACLLLAVLYAQCLQSTAGTLSLKYRLYLTADVWPLGLCLMPTPNLIGVESPNLLPKTSAQVAKLPLDKRRSTPTSACSWSSSVSGRLHRGI